ncbi:MAG TPA: mechanosensitive ion channel family protein [Saprospiraceae bacterium]|nr:mechanosensitive ion channel family protein [Saprospiraceae bacterium]
MDTFSFWEKLADWAWHLAPKVLMALVMLVAGFWAIRRITRIFSAFLRQREVDDSLRPFFTSLTDTGLKVLLVFMVANTFGIQTTSFIAVFSAVAFSIGMALQGSLGNFASGVLVLLFRPYRVGDLLHVAGKSGRVTEIQIFSTILVTPQGKKIIIPNSKMTEGPIENIEMDHAVQAEVLLLLNPKTSMDWLRATVEELVSRCPMALPERTPSIHITGITRDDIKVQVAMWTLGQHHDDAVNYLYEGLKHSFEAAGIELAKEQRKEK